MRSLWQPVQIIKVKESGNQTFLAVATSSLSESDIKKYATSQGIFGVIKLWDSRRITPEQRKKIFATCQDIADYIGEPRELIRYDLISKYAEETGIEFFSLSECSLETARELINYILNYVMENDIPLTGVGTERTDDINSYLYGCIKHKKCCCCGKEGHLYKFKDNNYISLCNIHYDEAKVRGLKEFQERYKVYPIKISKGA
ncbi:putative HNHc nuclease [Rhodopseudomonas parapalustris]